MPLTPAEREAFIADLKRRSREHVALGLPAMEIIAARVTLPASQRLRSAAIDLKLDNSSLLRALLSESYERMFGKPIDSIYGS